MSRQPPSGSPCFPVLINITEDSTLYPYVSRSPESIPAQILIKYETVPFLRATVREGTSQRRKL